MNILLRSKFYIKSIVFLFINLVFSVDCIYAQYGIAYFNGNLVIGSFASTNIEINKSDTIIHDKIIVSGVINLNGTLNIIWSGKQPSPQDQIEIIVSDGAILGNFTEIIYHSSMIDWNIDYGKIKNGVVTLFGPKSNLATSYENSFETKEEFMYPNPSNGLVYSKYPSLKGSIFNINGYKVQTFLNEQIIDLSLLKNGIYFLKFNDINKFYKVVITK